MAIVKNFNRMKPIVAEVEINLADVTTGVDLVAIDLPPGAVIRSGEVVTTEAWDSTTTDVLDVGDGVSQNRYLNDGNIRALGAVVPLVPTGHVHPGGALTVRWVSGGGVPTTGKARLVVEYYIRGTSAATHG